MIKIGVMICLIATLGFGQTNRSCSDAPQAVTSFNSDWYYSEFNILENQKILSLYGGFERPRYTPAEYDYIAQFYRPGQSINTLDDYQLFNYDLIHEPLYNREYDISNLNLLGEGILRIAVPITHGVIWNQACVTVEVAAEEAPAAVPEPSSLALILVGAGGLLFFANRRRLK